LSDDSPANQGENIMQANYAYICPNQFTAEDDCDLIAAHYPKFEDAKTPGEARLMAQNIANLIGKPVTVSLWERHDSFYGLMGELEPDVVQSDPVLVCARAVGQSTEAITVIARDLRVIAALI
jgi:hypothetical protein